MSLLALRDIHVDYGFGAGRLRAVRGVSLSVSRGETVGLVGESGCGKSTLAKAAVGLIPIARGSIDLEGADVSAALQADERSVLQRIQLIHQDPHGSLNPRMSVEEVLGEAINAHRRMGRSALRAECSRLLDLVELSYGALHKRPREFSGGQRQRIAIARALAVQPSVLVADEITSALDVSVQASILNLLRGIQGETGVGCLFISHNMSVVRYVSDRVAVMHLGRLVEEGPSERLFAGAEHPYTRVLLDSVPRVTRAVSSREPTRALREPVDPHHVPSGCSFRTRCPQGPEVDGAKDPCVLEEPQLLSRHEGHRTACHFPGVSNGTASALRRS